VVIDFDVNCYFPITISNRTVATWKLYLLSYSRHIAHEQVVI
jgi:hypothetical protein